MALFSVLTATPGALAGENLIPNGDLEQNTTIGANGLPAGMASFGEKHDPPVVNFSLSQKEKTSGENSLCIERFDAPQARSRILVSPFIPVEPGKRYSFSCKIKSTDAKPQVILYAYDKDKQEFPEIGLPDSETTTPGAIIAHKGALLQLDISKSENPDSFNKVEWTFSTPTDGCYLSVVIDYSPQGPGKAWFDDFELRAVD